MTMYDRVEELLNDPEFERTLIKMQKEINSKKTDSKNSTPYLILSKFVF